MAAAGADELRSPARRGMYVLPSTFTAGNIAIGYYSIVQSIRGMASADPAAFDRATLAIIFAISSTTVP